MSLAPSLAIFRHAAYRRYWIMRQLVSASRQMLAVAIGWQVYDLARQTRSIEESAFLLGLVGLMQFAPVPFLSLIAGQVADRFDRKTILIVSNLVRLIGVALLLMATSMQTDAAIMTRETNWLRPSRGTRSAFRRRRSSVPPSAVSCTSPARRRFIGRAPR